MSDDFDLKMFETKAELAELKEEIKEIRNQNNALKNEMALRTFIETGDESARFNLTLRSFKKPLPLYPIEVASVSVGSKPYLDSNYDDKFSELNENLRKINEQLEKHDTILRQQNETTQVLKTSENNLEEQTILLLGGIDGKDSDSLVMLENNGQNWKQLNIKLPYGTYNHGAQFLNNNIYIFGGWNSSNGCLNWTYKLSKGLQWEKMTDMNQKRRDISNSNVILNNHIWVCGGGNLDGWGFKSVEMYDPETNKWKYMKEMNAYRSSAAAAVVNGKIFCSGGSDHNSVECYDPSSDVWTIISKMPQKTGGHGAVEIGGHFIVMGGWDLNRREFLNSVWALDITDKNAVWIEEPSMSRTREDFSIAKIHDEIFVCGGKNSPNMPTGKWKATAVVISMEFARELEQFIADSSESSEDSDGF